MHARMTKFTAKPDQIDGLTEYYRNTVLPEARKLDGFKGGVALTNRETGESVSFTLWESEEALRASEEAGNRLRGRAASDLELSEPTVERYEVGVLEIS